MRFRISYVSFCLDQFNGVHLFMIECSTLTHTQTGWRVEHFICDYFPPDKHSKNFQNVSVENAGEIFNH